MSYHTYINYGYGFEIKDITKLNAEKIRVLFQEYIKEENFLEDEEELKNVKTAELEELIDLVNKYVFDTNTYGIAVLIQREIVKAHPEMQCYIFSCENYDGESSVMFGVGYPWEFQELQNLTEDYLDIMFAETINKVSDMSLQELSSVITYIESENGG